MHVYNVTVAAKDQPHTAQRPSTLFKRKQIIWPLCVQPGASIATWGLGGHSRGSLSWERWTGFGGEGRVCSLKKEWVPAGLRAVLAPCSKGVSPIGLQVMFRGDRKAKGEVPDS